MSAEPNQFSSDTTEEKQWLGMLVNGEEEGLSLIFNKYYKYLVITGFKIIHDDHRAKDIVQDVFFKLWENRAKLNIQSSLKSYLRKAVSNKCIDHIRKNKKIHWKEDLENSSIPDAYNSIIEEMEASELQKIINEAIQKLPNRCREVFSLSRFENMSHKEIAVELDISVKTIENQITKALKFIRKAVHSVNILLFFYIGWLELLMKW